MRRIKGLRGLSSQIATSREPFQPVGPTVTALPSVLPAVPEVGVQLTATEGQYDPRGAGGEVSVGGKRWLVNGVQVGTGATYTPTAANILGTLVYQEIATETGGEFDGTSIVRQASAGIVPIIAPAPYGPGDWTASSPEPNQIAFQIVNDPEMHGGTLVRRELRVGLSVYDIGLDAQGTVDDLEEAGTEDVQIRAVNEVGPSEFWSNVIRVDVTDPSGWSILPGDGDATINSYPDFSGTWVITPGDGGATISQYPDLPGV
ncbi:hypothetical protein [Tropicimonas sp. S265A]|uniref:hypothetical protein n=1 Tax=Tropicimonas sp. S265A TaxID=3415134 RepID=UPI003C7C5DB5